MRVCMECFRRFEFAKMCLNCGGATTEMPTATIACPTCGGEGRIYKSRWGGNDPDVEDVGQCEECDGDGTVEEEIDPDEDWWEEAEKASLSKSPP